jgi:hypothetical protein
MGRLAVAIALLAALVPGPGSAKTAVLVTVDKSHQRMTVSVDGIPRYRLGHLDGVARQMVLKRILRLIDAVFGFLPRRLRQVLRAIDSARGAVAGAIHGSYDIARLGGPASHGCIRLHPANAAILFRLIKTHGTGNTRIIVRRSVRTNAKRHPRTKHRRVGRRRNADA